MIYDVIKLHQNRRNDEQCMVQLTYFGGGNSLLDMDAKCGWIVEAT